MMGFNPNPGPIADDCAPAGAEKPDPGRSPIGGGDGCETARGDGQISGRISRIITILEDDALTEMLPIIDRLFALERAERGEDI